MKNQALQTTDLGLEEWRPVAHNPLYQVSSQGSIRRNGKILTTHKHSCGYLYFIMCDGVTKKNTAVHQLVAKAFHGESPGPKWEPNHKNGIKTDNRADNLVWTTRSDNQKHAHDLGLKKSGAQSHLWKKLLPEQVKEIRSLAGIFSQSAIGKVFGISQTYVGKIIRRTKWRQLA